MSSYTHPYALWLFWHQLQCILNNAFVELTVCMQATLLDYTQSEVQLRTARDSKQLNLASE